MAAPRFSHEDIVDYYRQTEVHYRKGWDLERSLALHYGFYREDTRNFRESLAHMNEEMAAEAGVRPGERVLDAGCGIGGSSLYLARAFDCRVTGVTLSPLQVERAERLARTAGLAERVDFLARDYCATGLPADSFDLVWALESVVHAADKSAFLREAFRLLRPGGRVIIGDYYLRETPLSPAETRAIRGWLDGIAANSMPRASEFGAAATRAGFDRVHFRDITPHIRRSARKQYFSSWYLSVVAWLYRLYNPGVSRFADGHYRIMYYQGAALWRGAWKYCFVRLDK